MTYSSSVQDIEREGTWPRNHGTYVDYERDQLQAVLELRLQRSKNLFYPARAVLLSVSLKSLQSDLKKPIYSYIETCLGDVVLDFGANSPFYFRVERLDQRPWVPNGGFVEEA